MVKAFYGDIKRVETAPTLLGTITAAVPGFRAGGGGSV